MNKLEKLTALDLYSYSSLLKEICSRYDAQCHILSNDVPAMLAAKKELDFFTSAYDKIIEETERRIKNIC